MASQVTLLGMFFGILAATRLDQWETAARAATEATAEAASEASAACAASGGGDDAVGVSSVCTALQSSSSDNTGGGGGSGGGGGGGWLSWLSSEPGLQAAVWAAFLLLTALHAYANWRGELKPRLCCPVS